MGESGILGDDPRVELLHGIVMVREPTGHRHAGTVNRLTRLWTRRLGDRAVVHVQNPIQFPEEMSELQPDVTLLRPRADLYASAHPRASDVLLLIEVADATLRLDRRVKIPLYARAGVPEAWLIDLVSDRVETYRSPSTVGWRDVATFGRGATFAPLGFPDVVVGLADLLG